MRNAVLVTLFISAMAFSAMAQERGPRAAKKAEDMAQMRTDRLTERLALTEDQQNAVYALSLENAKRMQAIHEERAARSAEMRNARTAKMEERRAELRASQERLNEILTDEQREVLKQQQTDRAEKMRTMRDAQKASRFKGDRSKKGNRGFHKKSDSKSTPETLAEPAE